MNKQKISIAIDNVMDTLTALKEAIAADTSLTLKMEMTVEEVQILREVTRLDVSIPEMVHKNAPSITMDEVEHLLHKLYNGVKR